VSNAEQERVESTIEKKINTQAAEWIERRDFGKWSDTDQAKLDGWLAESLTHRVAFLRLNSSWKRTERLIALRSPTAASTSASRERRIGPGIAKVAIVSATLMFFGAAIAAYFSIPRYETYATTVGGHETLTLNDGSQIEMNTDTRIRVSDKADQRLVWLDKGEAYFQIRHDAAHPFVVLAAGDRVTDLGTKFLIRNDPDRLEIALVEGLARFESANTWIKLRSALLTPGDVVVATAGSMSVMKKSQRNLAGDLGWRRGVLVFDYTTLADAAAEFNRYNREKIVIADAVAGRLTVVGTFPVNNVELFGHVTQVILGLRVEKRQDEVVISR
jgi:transmembrane sensor